MYQCSYLQINICRLIYVCCEDICLVMDTDSCGFIFVILVNLSQLNNFFGTLSQIFSFISDSCVDFIHFSVEGKSVDLIERLNNIFFLNGEALWNLFISLYLFVCLFVCPFAPLPANSTSLHLCLCFSLSLSLSVYLSVYLSLFLSLSLCPFIHTYIHASRISKFIYIIYITITCKYLQKNRFKSKKSECRSQK